MILVRRCVLVATTVLLSSDRVWMYTTLTILNVSFLFIHMLARVRCAFSSLIVSRVLCAAAVP